MPKAFLSPGALLQATLKKNNLDCTVLAAEIGYSMVTLHAVTQNKGQITVPLAMHLAKFFNTSAEYWLVPQMKYDLSEAEKDKTINAALKAISTMRDLNRRKKEKEIAARRSIEKRKQTLADIRKKAGKVPGAKPAARNPKAVNKPQNPPES